MEERIISMSDSTKIYSEIYNGNKDTWIIATHGIGEHCKRHQYLVDLFADKYNMFLYDLRGHGKSSGPKADIKSFESFMEDLKELIKYLRINYGMKKFVLFGHSMGALITCSFIQRYLDDETQPEKVIVNAPPIGFDGILGDVVSLIPKNTFAVLSKLPFSFPVKGMVDLTKLSHDQSVAQKYKEDDLCAKALNSRLLTELVHASKKTFALPLRSKCPSFVSYGTGDVIVGVKPLREYFTLIDKSFKVTEIDGSFHEIHNEIEEYRRPYFDYLTSIL